MAKTITIAKTVAAAAAVAVDGDERARRLRGRNLATLAALVGLAALFYAVTVVRVGGM